MRKIGLALLLAASLCPALASAQVDLQIHLGLPVAPPLVVVQPGIQVVPAFEEEVFFHRGWYWARRGPSWYRARSPQVAFAYVEPRLVPAPLVRLPPGHYRQYRAGERHAWKEQEKAERKAWKRHEKEERKAHREREKERRKGNGHGHGHD